MWHLLPQVQEALRLCGSLCLSNVVRRWYRGPTSFRTFISTIRSESNYIYYIVRWLATAAFSPRLPPYDSSARIPFTPSIQRQVDNPYTVKRLSSTNAMDQQYEPQDQSDELPFWPMYGIDLIFAWTVSEVSAA